MTDAITPSAHGRAVRPWGLGVDHGLRPTTDKIRLTRADKNVVHELNGQPAFDVYRDHAEKRSIRREPESAGSSLIGNEIGIEMDGWRNTTAVVAAIPV